MRDIESAKVLRLVNRKHTLKGDFEPEGLTAAADYGINVAKSGVRLQKCACIALAMLTQYALAQGAGEMVLYSGYRSYAEQKELHENKIRSLLANGFSLAWARQRACTIVAPPGASEHQLGLAADITVPELAGSHDPLVENFAETGQGIWLLKNAPAFGFILRYPKDKTETTGVIYEPWHFRYVGSIAARRISHGNMCLEEYLYAC